MPKVQKYDEDGLRLQTYERNRGEIRPLEKDDASAILNLCIDSMKNHGGRPATYPNTEKGLADFREMSLKYLEHVQRVNSNDDMERQLILDYESWAVYCGVCRQTVWLYEKRGGEWSAFIRYMREVITATKKQLMMTYKIPAVVGIFDLTNNAQYVNTNKIEIERTDTEEAVATVEDGLQEAGLKWDQELNDFVTGDTDNVDT